MLLIKSSLFKRFSSTKSLFKSKKCFFRRNLNSSEDLEQIKKQYFENLVQENGGKYIYIGEGTKGRGIFAKQDIPSNTHITFEISFSFFPFLIIILLFLSLISFFNEPFVSFPHFEYLTDANTKSKRDFCNHCLVTVNNETHKSSCSCDVCKERYCSKECKEKAWNQYHEVICNVDSSKLFESCSKQNSIYPLLAIKVFSRILLDVKSSESFDNSWNKLLILQFVKDWEHPSWFMSYRTFRQIFISENNAKVFDYEWWKRLMQIFVINSFIIEVPQNSKFIKSGMGLFLLSSFYNHSCVPNASIEFLDTHHSRIHTIKDIKKGEEVLISYVDVTLPKSERHSLLRSYGFVCNCLKCQAEV